jgi:hypothetical protein
MTDPRLRGLFSSLEERFDAAIGCEEDEAADDLAISLRQGRALGELIELKPWRVSVCRRVVSNKRSPARILLPPARALRCWYLLTRRFSSSLQEVRFQRIRRAAFSKP